MTDSTDDEPLGHQLHWFALLETPERASAYLNEAVDRVGLVVGSDPENPPFFLIATDDDTMIHMLFVVTRDGDGNDVIIDRYPLLKPGLPVTVTGVDVMPDGNGAAALRTVVWDAAYRIVCFDPLYFRSEPSLGRGETTEVSFAGLAIHAEVMAPERLAEGNMAADIAALVPASVAYPENDSRPDWHGFYAHVQAVEEVILAGVRLYRCDVVLLRGDSGDLAATLLVGDHVMPEGAVPRPGDVLGGVMWLMGVRTAS